MNNDDFNCFITHCTQNDAFFGQIINPTSVSRIEGPCGDNMEFYLVIKDDIIVDVKYFTETGCCNTKISGRAVAQRVLGKNIIEALSVNPYQIISEEKGLSPQGQHCAILAVSTFYQAVVLYLLGRE
ncbi:MAG: iron-sulfur cluster assembly scaffold protein [Candidatus Delongbacteria bacterium]|nr:iron-sulfur cluster assembly scaffold protein [Candidatus Delongbacteria bacterium]MCG2761110.1 iron-sulfur cluster assembly scaffold protein [Candidatus Delongbacteria bacterium]